MYILPTTQYTPLSRAMALRLIPRTSIDYVVVFTESCKFVRVGTYMLDVACISSNDIIADIVSVNGDSLLTDGEKVQVHHYIMMYFGDNSNQFKISYADGVVLTLDDVNDGIDF